MKPINTISLGLANNKVGSSFGLDQSALLTSRNQASRGSSQQSSSTPLGSLPIQAHQRRVRDSGSLLLMIAFLAFLAYVIWDGMLVKETDINLIVHGHDSYGNICGRNNKPIKQVNQSGKNFTDKPYTKYHLINAQFERYTLDMGRSKNGELLYIKQEAFSERMLGPIRNGEDDTKKITRRIKRSQVLFEQPEVIRRNQTLLNNIKSSLMYSYPAMYGYKPTLSKYQQAEIDRNKQQIVAADTQKDSAILPTGTSRIAGQENTLKVILDDQIGNNSLDTYDHILVPPKSTNSLRSRSPDILNQFEVNNQLLYLTECVEHCPSDHVELIFYRCMPKNWRFSLFPNAINVTRTFVDDILTDMSHCYRELIYIFSFALVLSLALLILLRFLASIIIWSCLILVILLISSMATYSWTYYYYQILELNNLMPHDSMYAEKLASTDKWLVGSIFLTFVSFATIATVIFMRKRILLVTMLFKESGKAISDMPLLLLQPVLTFAALALIITLWTIGLICLQSIKVPMIDRNTGFVVFRAETLYKVMKWYHIFAFLWVSHFAIACQHYVIGASVSKWYFSTDRYNLHSPIGSSVSELILYYMGSVALGSFLVAIFKVVRIITRQIQYLVQRNCLSPANSHQSTSSSPTDLVPAISAHNSTCATLSYIWRMFIWFFDNIVMIINRDAYVEIAIHGHSFLSGAKRAFKVLAANPLRLLAIKSVSNVLLIIAKICVVFGTVSMALLLLEEKTNQLNYSWSPVVISALYAYIVAHWFLSVYEMVIDALFICYCEDYEQTKSTELNNQIIGSNFMSQILNNQTQLQSNTTN